MSSSVDDSTARLYESYVRGGMSDQSARYVIHCQCGILLPEGGPIPPTPAPGSLAEANEMLIKSYIESGMQADTARKIVSGL